MPLTDWWATDKKLDQIIYEARLKWKPDQSPRRYFDTKREYEQAGAIVKLTDAFIAQAAAKEANDESNRA